LEKIFLEIALDFLKKSLYNSKWHGRGPASSHFSALSSFLREGGAEFKKQNFL